MITNFAAVFLFATIKLLVILKPLIQIVLTHQIDYCSWIYRDREKDRVYGLCCIGVCSYFKLSALCYMRRQLFRIGTMYRNTPMKVPFTGFGACVPHCSDPRFVCLSSLVNINIDRMTQHHWKQHSDLWTDHFHRSNFCRLQWINVWNFVKWHNLTVELTQQVFGPLYQILY